LLTVAIIGAGPLGRWLALTAARAGFRVLLEDVMPTNLHHAQEYIRRQLTPVRLPDASATPNCVSAGEITTMADGIDFRDLPAFHEDTGFREGSGVIPSVPSPSATGDLPSEPAESGGAPGPQAGLTRPAASSPDELRAITFVSTIEDAVREADLAIDCVPDELESKLEILWLLDRMAPPRTVLLTPTTRLSISDLAACTYRTEKCVAIVAEARGLAEFPASEILLRTTSRTTPETIALVEHFWLQLGYSPRFEQESAPAR
jgi:3-hydroxybutyryl-CoA dehydrogenase